MITIDNDLRTINIPSDTRLLGVVGDKDVNTLEFEMPRRYKGLDLSEYEIQIRYKNIERGWAALPVFEKQFPEVGHTVKDSELVEIDVDEMKFSVEDEILIMSRK